MGEWKDEIYRSLPLAGVDLDKALYGEPPDNRKYTRSVTINMDVDMYELLRTLAHHIDLPFNGNLNSLGRHALATFIEGLQKYLDGNGVTMLRKMEEAYRRQTTEMYVVMIDEHLSAQVDILQAWTASREWETIYQDLAVAAKAIDDFPHRAWRRRAALGWLQQPGVQGLLLGWEQTMKQEAPGVWQRVVELFGHWEEEAGV